MLEAETGSGKTEAALARFLVLLHAGLVEGLYFALPTRTAATQIHERVVAATKRAFPNEATRPPVVLAVPGYLRVDEAEGTRLPGFKVLWNDDRRERLRHRGWAAEHPKRYLSGAIVVGTIDQVLLSTLQVSHAHLRATALLRHLLVIDEVHASDAYMNRLLEDVLSRHLEAGGFALLMSATLGAETRARLVRPVSRQTLPSFDEACATPYPLITHRPVGGEVVSMDPGVQRSVTVSVEIRGIAGDPSAVARTALDAAAQGAKVLVLRNTVKDCLATQVEMESAARERGAEELLFSVRGRAAPHHSRFARSDRMALDQALEARIGKNRPEGGCVAVATQTVQQSLDLDADLMLTDLCPMDVLLQRLGRLHRHVRSNRPNGFESPRAVVLASDIRDLSSHINSKGEPSGEHGFGTVYDDLRVIEATWRVLEQRDRLAIPGQSRNLVESSLHSEILGSIVDELGDSWKRHADWALADLLADRRQAGLNLADWNAPFGEQACLFPSDELARRIQTRLGEGDRRVRFVEPLPSPFGHTVDELNMPAFMAPSAPDDAEPIDIEVGGGMIQFTYGGRPFIYDRWGFRPNEAKHEEDHG